MDRSDLAEIFVKNGLTRKIIKPGDFSNGKGKAGNYKERWYYSPGYPLSIKFDYITILLGHRGHMFKSFFEISEADARILVLCLKLNTAQLRALFPGASGYIPDFLNFDKLPENTFDYFREKYKYISSSGLGASGRDILHFEILRLYDEFQI